MSETTMHTPYGALRGRATATGLAFLGIRYGAPPIGARRWAPPARYRAARRRGRRNALRALAAADRLARDALARRFRAARDERGLPQPQCLDACRRRTRAVRCSCTCSAAASRPGARARACRTAPRFRRRPARSSCASISASARWDSSISAIAFGADFAAGNVGLLDLCLGARMGQRQYRRARRRSRQCHDVRPFVGRLHDRGALRAAADARPLRRAWMQSGSASRVLTRAAGVRRCRGIPPRSRSLSRGTAQALETLGVETILAAQRKIAALDLGDRNAPGGRTLGIVEDGARFGAPSDAAPSRAASGAAFPSCSVLRATRRGCGLPLA